MKGGTSVSLPSSLPATDEEEWKLLSPSRRDLARRRIDAIEGWRDGELDIEEACRIANVSISRFYRLAAAWRDHPSLGSLAVRRGSGASARARPSKGEVVNALQAVVGKVVRAHADASVAQLTRHMVEAAGVDPTSVPSPMVLRRIVETEIRRVKATGEAGHALRFDCSAISAPQGDGRPWILFVVLDVGTRMILGWHVAESALALPGYQRAACDALAKLDDLSPPIWATRLTEVEIKSGLDKEATAKLVERLDAAIAGNVQHADSDARFGRYFKKLVGGKLGLLTLTPARTLCGDALPPNGDMTPWSRSELETHFAIKAAEYNDEVMREKQDLASDALSEIPADVLELLQMVAELQ